MLQILCSKYFFTYKFSNNNNYLNLATILTALNFSCIIENRKEVSQRDLTFSVR